MNQLLDKLEVNVYQLAQKFETQLGENKRLQEEVARLNDELSRQHLAQEQQKNEHQAAVGELSEALMVQMNKLKTDMEAQHRQTTETMQSQHLAATEAMQAQHRGITGQMQAQIDALTAENQKYRNALSANAEHLRTLLARLPQEAETTAQEG
ncbi:hypothetical protein BWD09_07330 [Neisseria dentiae]|uniref:Uncharacterized protein n=1 Tax=Neisseria dentiae TaxID=194197 RepID=A0A1X3D9Z2_9NEIS|nr:hypothetical protein [Neisseria dentiae]OSI16347.1 hypothetical protein BWD09_07330 [Neisseria dentiae]QMT45395.1 hypothetical protein H3L92_00630 [Neisseria dentiae]STZ51172.1 Uncharacterised protein [Neisseria dentiae]